MLKPAFIFGFTDKTNFCVKTTRCENTIRVKDIFRFVKRYFVKTYTNYCTIILVYFFYIPVQDFFKVEVRVP